MMSKRISRVFGLLITTLIGGQVAHASSSNLVWKYEGSLDVPSRASMCYWAPFDFADLKGVSWYLALESDSVKSCLLGTHPDAQSSLWQISPSGKLWLKRQGRSIAMVEKVASGSWEVTSLIAMPDEVISPKDVILWGHDNHLTLLDNGQIWNMRIGERWRRVNSTKIHMEGFVERGFVQTQSYLYYWGTNAGVLIHKRSGRIQRFLNDKWPDLLKEFEQLGTTWTVDGDEVIVRNAENELLFNLDQKTLLTKDLLFQGIDGQGERGLSRLDNTSRDDWKRLWDDLKKGAGMIWFLFGLAVGILVMLLMRFFRFGRDAGGEAEDSVDEATELNAVQLSGLSESFQALVLVAPGVLTTEAFDQAIGNDANQSPESLRSKRSKVIRDVNNESLLVIGYELIERDRDQVDRRKVTYRIKSVPVRLTRQIEQQYNKRARGSSIWRGVSS